MKKSIKVGFVLFLVVFTLIGCTEKKDKTSTKQTSVTAQKTESSAADKKLKKEVAKMLKELKTVTASITEKDKENLTANAKTMHKHWLDFENSVRSAYPLEYTNVEKYETPIYYGSQYAEPDYTTLSENAKNLKSALNTLEDAKKTKAKTSKVLNEAVAGYQEYVQEQAVELVTANKKFTDAVRAGDVTEAKAQYSKSRVYYERIEPVAESFGDLDPEIDARINDVDSEADWTGYHVIERALWQNNTTDGMATYADKLDEDIQELADLTKKLKMKPKDMVAGAMELLNEAATTKITGEEEAYSHTDLVDLVANVEGSKVVYQAIIPALNQNDSELGDKLDTQFNKMEEILAKYQSGDSYVSYEQLTKDQIREISTELSTLSELMAKTGEIFN